MDATEEGLPKMLDVQPDNIPDDLKERDQWVAWKVELDAKGRPTKIPYDAQTGRKASSVDKTTWRTFDGAVAAYERPGSGYTGIGYVLAEDDNVFGIDLDHCVVDGVIQPWTDEQRAAFPDDVPEPEEIVTAAGSYAEISPSKTGLRIICLGAIPPGRRKCGDFEVYDAKRYLTVTGHHWGNSPIDVRNGSGFDPVYHKFLFTKQKATKKPVPRESLAPDDSRIMEKIATSKSAGKMELLWAGSIDGYPSESEADLALAGMLVFWTQDPAQIERLMRSSGLVREKWDNHPDYLERTITKVIESATDTYDWNRSGRAGDYCRQDEFEPSRAASAEPDDDWPEILPFDTWNPPAMSVEHFPKTLRDWIEEESHATQTPVEMATMLSLSVCSAAIAKRVAVEARPGWNEPTNLFTATLAEPGSRKSAVFSDAIKPLREIESQLAEQAAPDVAREMSNRRQDEARLKDLEKKAVRSEDPLDRRRAADAAADLVDHEPLAMPRLLVDDITTEKLGIVLGEQKGRLASMSPEGGVFDIMGGRYAKNGGTSFDVYLKGHAGDDVVVDRVSRPSIRVSRPALTCAYAIQPEVIRGVSGNPAFRGRGLLARFLYVYPPGQVGSREIAPTPMSESTREGYHNLVLGLYEDASLDSGDEGAFVLRLDDDAGPRLIAWEMEIESMLAEGGQMDHMRDWGGKLAGATLRLAAVLHCIESGAYGLIGLKTMEVAIELARCLIPHADHTLNLMAARQGSVDSDAGRLLRWIDRRGRGDFTKREAYRGNSARFPSAEDANDPLADLTQRGYIRPLPPGPPQNGRPPSPSFAVNPGKWTLRQE